MLLLIFFPVNNADLLPLASPDRLSFKILRAHGKFLKLMDHHVCDLFSVSYEWTSSFVVSACLLLIALAAVKWSSTSCDVLYSCTAKLALHRLIHSFIGLCGFLVVLPKTLVTLVLSSSRWQYCRRTSAAALF